MIARKTTAMLATLALAAGGSIATAATAHAESVQTWYMAVTGDDSQLHKLGTCTASTHEVIWQIPAGARSDIFWINDWPAGTIENLTAQQLIDQMTAKGYSGNRGGYNWANGPEARANAMIAGHAYEVDCVPDGQQQGGDTNNGTIPLTPTPSVTPKPTPVPTTPKPVVVKPTPAPVARIYTKTFQVDRYLPNSAAMRRRVASLDDDGKLGFREDRMEWNHSRWAIVTVSVKSTTTPTAAQWITAINRATPARVGVVRTTARTTTVTSPVVEAWEITKGAWKDSRGGAAQTFFARS